MDLSGSVFVITGGATGLGAAIAREAAAKDATVAINYRSPEAESEAEALVAALRRDGRRAAAFRADISDWADAADLMQRVGVDLGPVDVLVNNAGVTRAIPAERIDLVTRDDWTRVLETNLVGTFACIQAVLPGMRERRFGRILNVASDSAFTASGSSIPYVVSKAGIVSLTQALAAALGPDIRVNAIAPGWMATPWLPRYLSDADRTAVEAGPILSPGEVAAKAVALIADDVANGTILRIDPDGEPRHGAREP